MFKINRFLGFTDNIKEPRKTKVENELMHRYSYNGNVYNANTFLCVKLLEGCYPEKEENVQYYKRNGELSKPKTVYKYMSPDGKTYFEMNKTQYDFVYYLMENNLNTEESMLTYDKADIERYKAEKKAEEEEQKQKEEERKQAREKEELFKKWMEEESQKITQEQKDIVDKVFMDIYGQQNTWIYSIVPCINNYDNPMCKAEIISRMHNDNKASIKIFECLTGLKLPKGYKERIAYLEGLTKADFKTDNPIENTKTTSRKKNKKEGIFYIYITTKDGKKWHPVYAEPYVNNKVENIRMHIREKTLDEWVISLAESGVIASRGKTRQEAIDALDELIERTGKDQFIQMVDESKKKIYESIGVNPKYAMEGFLKHES